MAPVHADAAPSCLDRVHDFVSENRRAIILATAAALVAAGAAYYASSSARPPSAKGKAKDRKPKKKSVNDRDGPIIEEISSTVEDVDGRSHRLPSYHPTLTLLPAENAPLSPEQIAAMPFEVRSSVHHPVTSTSLLSLQERVKQAASLKTRGNSLYQARKFEQAVDLYTQAIAVSPRPEPVFYSNRAACLSHP